MSSGIPHGSVLVGPILCVIDINDLPECVQNEVYLFADGTNILSQVTKENTVIHSKMI